MKHMPLDVRVPIEPDNPSIVRAEEKCIKCGMCKNVCTQDIGVHGTYTLERTGGEAVCCVFCKHFLDKIAKYFWTLLQNVFGHCCMSKLDKVAMPRLAA